MLNPRWVEWLMGFPVGWSNYTPLGTRKSSFKPPTLSAS
jgi:hypothetical protein